LTMHSIEKTPNTGMPSAEMEYDVVVVGGGVMGATMAAALVEQNIKTIVVEKGCCGAQGASRYSGGLTRLYDPDPDIMALAAHSHHCLSSTHFGRVFNSTIQRKGLIYMCDEAELGSLNDAITSIGNSDYPMRLLQSGEALQITEFVAEKQGRAILYEEKAGQGDVRGSVAAMANLVKNNGVVLENSTVLDIEQRDNVAYIHLERGLLKAKVVVIAGGAWSAPWLPELKQITRSIPLVRLFASLPLKIPIIDTVAETYAVPLNGNLVHVGSQVRQEAKSPDTPFTHDGSEHIDALKRLSMLSGRTETGPIYDTLPGFDSYVPDRRPVIGFLSSSDSRYALTGMAGIGYKLAVGVADIGAQQIIKRLGKISSKNDVSVNKPQSESLLLPFSPSRLEPSFL
jgi:glycine/D-amino acid oxidase-like deaminating enzyme